MAMLFLLKTICVTLITVKSNKEIEKSTVITKWGVIKLNSIIRETLRGKGEFTLPQFMELDTWFHQLGLPKCKFMNE